MYTYAQILDSKVHWIMTDELTLDELYEQKYNQNDITFVDITSLTTQPEVGWTYDSTTATFSEPVAYSTVSEAQTAKLSELSNAAASAYTAGFSSSASGTAMWYDSDTENQAVIQRLYAEAKYDSTAYDVTVFMTGITAGQAPIRAKVSQIADDSTKTIQYLTSTEMVTLGDDWATYYATLKAKLWSLQAEVYEATTVAEVEAISWD